VQASIFPDIYETVVAAPQGQFPTEKLALKNVPWRQIVDAGDGIPGRIGRSRGLHEAAITA
jgi:hypothetical protein